MFLVCNFCNLWESNYLNSLLPNFFLKFRCSLHMYVYPLVHCKMLCDVLPEYVRIIDMEYSGLYLLTIPLNMSLHMSPLLTGSYFLSGDLFICIISYTYPASFFQYTLPYVLTMIGAYCQHLCTLFHYVPWHMLFDVHIIIGLSFSP